MSLHAVNKIWMNGSLVNWEDAKIHVLTHALHYGTGVFEGIRCYSTPSGSAVFRHRDHISRLFDSAKLYYMDIPYSQEQIMQAVKDTIKVNGLDKCYIRPIVFRGYGEMGLNPLNAPVDVSIAVWPWGAYLGEEGLEKGIRVKTSSYQRIPSNTLPSMAKATGQYINSILAKVETMKAGYDEALLLDSRGFVSEGPGENIFIVKDNVIYTPPEHASILKGITRDSVIQIARYLGYKVVEQDITRASLYLADEALFTGTAAEITPIREIDSYEIGEPGKITKEIQKVFFDIITGRFDEFGGWLDII